MGAVLEKPEMQDSDAENVDLLPKGLARERHFT